MKIVSAAFGSLWIVSEQAESVELERRHQAEHRERESEQLQVHRLEAVHHLLLDQLDTAVEQQDRSASGQKCKAFRLAINQDYFD